MKNLLIILFGLAFFVNQSNAQQIDDAFFNEVNTFMQDQVRNGLLDYGKLKNNTSLKALIKEIEEADLSTADEVTKKAFYINAYNLHVINAATVLYPTETVQSEGGFFDRKKVTIARQQYTLNTFEKERLLDDYKDPRLHFVLVCGALGCPPITNFAYRPEELEAQLDKQSKLALNNPNFIKVKDGEVELSKIFQWYSHDFGGNKKAIINFINQYRTTPIPTTVKISYYTYDWSLNNRTTNKLTLAPRKKKNNESRYISSSTISKGRTETKIFNNLYTQRTGTKESLTSRSTFFTTSVSFLYGLNNHLNLGFVTKYRRVRNDDLPSDALDVFSSGEAGSSRQGFTGIGPQIRYAPIPKWENFSIQSSIIFPIGKDLAGSESEPYIDWNGAIWNTQFFNDVAIGSSFSLFTEIDLLFEDIDVQVEEFGAPIEGSVNRFSTPVTLIFSYNPDPKVIVYALGGFSPYWQSDFDYFVQGGFGAKYQFTPNLELELLYTGFTNKFLLDTGGKAATYNLGLRFNL